MTTNRCGADPWCGRAGALAAGQASAATSQSGSPAESVIDSQERSSPGRDLVGYGLASSCSPF